MNARVNPQVILNLAKKASDKEGDEFTKILPLGVDDGMSAIIKEMMEEDEKSTQRAAAMHIVELIKAAKVKHDDLVEGIRSARRKADENKKILGKMTRATEYATHTRNYLPLMVLTGLPIDANLRYADPDLFIVPDDWKPPVVEVAAVEKRNEDRPASAE